MSRNVICDLAPVPSPDTGQVAVYLGGRRRRPADLRHPWRHLPFDAIGDEFLPALAVIAALLLLARPLSVLACLLPDRRAGWTRAELAFLCWTRETGVIPAALAGLLVAEGVPDAELVQVTVALALVVTLLVQATTKPWLATRPGLRDHSLPGGAPREAVDSTR